MYVDIIDAVILDADANVCERRIRISENAFTLLIDPDGPPSSSEVLAHAGKCKIEPGAILSTRVIWHPDNC